MQKYLEIGKIINKRGIKGELKVDAYTNSLDDFSSIDEVFLAPDGNNPLRIESCKPYNGFIYLKLSGVDTPEMADRLRNRILYVDRDCYDLNDDEIFIADIIGLTVFDAKNGKVYGKVVDVVNYGSHDTYVIKSDKSEYMLPAVDEFIDNIDIEKGVFVTPIPGLFDEAEEIS